MSNMVDKPAKDDMELWEAKVQKQYMDWRARRKEVRRLPNLRSFVSTVRIILEICRRFKHAGAGREENRRIALEKKGALRTRAELNLVQESMERLRYFQHINPFQLEALRRVVQYRNLYKGEVLFEEEELSKEYYVVAKGTISMHRKITGESGSDVPEFVTVAKYYMGESFNEGTLSQVGLGDTICKLERELDDVNAEKDKALYMYDMLLNPTVPPVPAGAETTSLTPVILPDQDHVVMELEMMDARLANMTLEHSAMQKEIAAKTEEVVKIKHRLKSTSAAFNVVLRKVGSGAVPNAARGALPGGLI
ncbi:hypothetical protein CYMTET_33292, partial [Cymbomonas tetramitiformis]